MSAAHPQAGTRHGPALYFCGCQACFSTWQSWGGVAEDGLLHLTEPHCPHCDNDDYTQAEPNAERARTEEETTVHAPYTVIMVEPTGDGHQATTRITASAGTLAAARRQADRALERFRSAYECWIQDADGNPVETVYAEDTLR